MFIVGTVPEGKEWGNKTFLLREIKAKGLNMWEHSKTDLGKEKHPPGGTVQKGGVEFGSSARPRKKQRSTALDENISEQ